MISDSLQQHRSSLRRTETGRPLLLAYVFALVLVVAVVAFKRIVHTPLGNDAPFLFMFGTTMLVTWFGGRGAGFAAAVLGTLAVNYFFLPPYEDWHSTPASAEQSILFGAENLLIAWLTSMLVTARTRAEAGADRIRRMYAVSSATGGARTLGEVASIVAREGAGAVGANTAAVFIADDTRPVLRLVAQFGADSTLTGCEQEIPVDGALPAATVFRTGELLCIGSGAHESRMSSPERRCPPNDSLVGVPIRLEGRTLGVLLFGFEGRRDVDPEERVLALILAQDCARATDRAMLSEAERRARLEAERANRAKDEFLGIVSHELRTPLMVIAGWLYLLRRTWDDRDRREHALAVIERSLKTQTRIIEDILDAQQILAHELKVERRPLDLASVAQSVVDELRPLAAARGVEITLSATGEVCVSGDAGRLRQVTRNLLENALKFTPRDGHIWVDLEASGGKARLRVRDDGKGIAQECLPVVFEVFRQADSSPTRSEGGLGLGLAIVRDLVEAHGGVARVESAGLGLGAMAVVELPLLEVTGDLYGPAGSGQGRPTEEETPSLPPVQATDKT